MADVSVLDFESARRLRWPLDESTAEESVARVPQRSPSTERTRRMKARFLDTKLMLDPEFAVRYTESWRENDGQPLLLRRALAYKDGLGPCRRPSPRSAFSSTPRRANDS